jgi:flap endonuclease-1
MGIKGLMKLLRQHGLTQQISIDALRGAKVSIDMSISVYQWCSVGASRKIVNSKGKYINHIAGAFFRLAHLLCAGILPVAVFDGQPPPAKLNTLAKRAARKNTVPADHHGMPSGGVFTEVMKLCRLMGVAVIQAPGEAEAQAVAIAGIDAVMTEDTDAIVFGAAQVLRGVNVKADCFESVQSDSITALGLTRAQFIDLCIMMGGDYTGTIPHVGPATALKYIRKYGSIESIAAHITVPEEFQYSVARHEYNNIPPVVEFVAPAPMTNESLAKLYDYLANIHLLQPRRINKTLNKLASYYGATMRF